MSKLIALATTFLATAVFAQAPLQQPDRALPEADFYNLEQQQLGLKGYDPVSYIENNQAVEGDENIQSTFGGVTYHFANQANKDLFDTDPTQFEPTYGGYCAWAMANNSYADINPRLFTIHNGRLHLFISRRTKFKFDRNVAMYEQLADDFWLSRTGESARVPSN